MVYASCVRPVLVEDDPLHARASAEYACAEASARRDVVHSNVHASVQRERALHSQTAAYCASRDARVQESIVVDQAGATGLAREREYHASLAHAEACAEADRAALATDACAVQLRGAHHNLASAEGAHGAALAAVDAAAARAAVQDRELTTAANRLSSQEAAAGLRAAEARIESDRVCALASGFAAAKANEDAAVLSASDAAAVAAHNRAALSRSEATLAAAENGYAAASVNAERAAAAARHAALVEQDTCDAYAAATPMLRHCVLLLP
eukprot:Sspe_Gene.28103::Locus_12542_Transcript_1_1_Confidence_1.000_Length_1755::g.28103::m.28103